MNNWDNIVEVSSSLAPRLRKQINKYRKEHNLGRPNVYNENMQFLKEELDYITKFEVDGDYDSKSLIEFLKNIDLFKNLKELEIKNINSSIGDLLRDALKKCDKLEVLTLENVNAKYINLRRLKNLKLLRICSNPYLKAIEGLSGLHELGILEIYDNESLNRLNIQSVSRDIVGLLSNDDETLFSRLDVNFYPCIIENISQSPKKNKIESIVETRCRWHEMINRQPDYQTRNKEQMAAYTTSVMRKVDKKADNIIRKLIKPTDTELEKIAIIYDYVTRILSYDYEALENPDRMKYKFNELNSNGMVQGFLEGKFVCEGYSRMMTYLLAKCGIESYETTCLVYDDEDVKEILKKNTKDNVIRLEKKEYSFEDAKRLFEEQDQEFISALDRMFSFMNHSIIKIELSSGYSYLCDTTFDAQRSNLVIKELDERAKKFKWNDEFKQCAIDSSLAKNKLFFMLTKDQIKKDRKLSDSAFDVCNEMIPQDEKERLLLFATKRVSNVLSEEKKTQDELAEMLNKENDPPKSNYETNSKK